MAEFTKEATEECGKVLLSLIANTVKLTVMNQLVPIIKDAIMSAVEDAKEEAKGGAAAESKEVEVKDRLVYDAKESQPDLFLIHLVDTPTVYTWFGNPYTTYHMYEIRIGSDKKNNGRFYCRGLEDRIRYNHLISLANKIKAEFKDNAEYKDKLKDFPVPPPALLHGYYCVCLSRNPNGAAHEPLVRQFLEKLTAAPWAPSQAAPKFFCLGDDWEQAQIARATMKQAALDTVEAFLGRPPWWYDFRDPFDESDVVRQLMCLVMDYKLIPRLRGKVNPPVCRAQSLRAAEELVITVIDAQTALWNGMQDKLNDLKGQIVKAIEEKAGEIGEKLKPIMVKVMAKLAEHQKPKAEKKEEAKDVSAKVGDFITAWQFANTEVGKKLITGLDAPEDTVLRALRHLQNDLNPRTIIENKFKEFALQLANGGYEFMAHPVVGYVIEDLARELGYTINRFNTVDAILNSAEPFFKSVDSVLQKLWDLVGKDANAVGAAIDAASAETWQGIGKSGVDLFHQYKSIRRETARKLQDAKTPEPAEDAVTGLIDEEFSMHMAALNAIRVTFLQGLRDGLTGDALGSKESIARTAHHVFRGAVIANIQIVAEEQWVKTAAVLTIYAKHMAFKKFMDVAWPAISEVLEAVQGILPSVVAEKIKGVPEKILQKVLEIVIFKASDYAMGKLIPLVEQHLFKQE